MAVAAAALPAARHRAGAARHASRSAARSRSAQIGLLLALVGMLFAVGGAAIETVFSGAYNVAQFFGWEWGKLPPPRRRPALHARLARDARCVALARSS